MGKKIFVSYSHAQARWVRSRLVPCLKAGTVEVLIDTERFEAGKSLVGQMDRLQDQSEATISVLSPEYLNSDSCRHEMERAIARNPKFTNGSLIPVKLVECNLPERIMTCNPLHVDLREESNAAWELLLRTCDADLGTSALDWLRARDTIAEFLERNQSVNLVVRGTVKWRSLVAQIVDDYCPTLGVVDLDSGATVSREGLVGEILKACHLPAEVTRRPGDLAVFNNRIMQRSQKSRVALLHFDNISSRNYGIDFLYALRFLVMQERKLVLFVVSRSPFQTLLEQIPADQTASRIDFMIIELNGH